MEGSKSGLDICRFRICKFTHLLKWIHGPQINNGGAAAVSPRRARGIKRLRSPMRLPCCGQTRWWATFLFLLSDHTQASKGPFYNLFSGAFFTLLLFVRDVKMATKHGVELLSGVPLCKKTVTCFTEDICMINVIRARVERCWLYVQC